MDLRIDELAQRAGTTSRNIRAYQASGLLPAPRLVGRTGWYGEEHLHRLELVRDLQERGFSLAAIRQTLDAWAHGGDLGHLIGFQHLLQAPWSDETPERYTLEEILERFPDPDNAALLPESIRLGLLVPQDDGTLEAPSPLLIAAGAELVRAGVPLVDVLAMVQAIKADIADIADRFIAIVARHVVDPIIEGRADPARVPEVHAAVTRLRAVAIEVLRPFLAQELRRAVEESIAARGRMLDAQEALGA